MSNGWATGRAFPPSRFPGALISSSSFAAVQPSSQQFLESAAGACRKVAARTARPRGRRASPRSLPSWASGDLDRQAEDVVLADRLHAGHVVLAGLRREAVDTRPGERELRGRAHVGHHPRPEVVPQSHAVHRGLEVPHSHGGPARLHELVRHDVVVRDRNRAAPLQGDRLARLERSAVQRPAVAAADLVADDERGVARRGGGRAHASDECRCDAGGEEREGALDAHVDSFRVSLCPSVRAQRLRAIGFRAEPACRLSARRLRYLRSRPQASAELRRLGCERCERYVRASYQLFICSGCAGRRRRTRASTATQPLASASTGLRSSSATSGRSSASRESLWSTSARAPESRAARPRKPRTSWPALPPRTSSSASTSVRGAIRRPASPISSARTPPGPKATSGPNTGSWTTPAR